MVTETTLSLIHFRGLRTEMILVARNAGIVSDPNDFPLVGGKNSSRLFSSSDFNYFFSLGMPSRGFS
jgi:hypothetical protein